MTRDLNTHKSDHSNSSTLRYFDVNEKRHASSPVARHLLAHLGRGGRKRHTYFIKKQETGPPISELYNPRS
jgi:hypothetical protein